MGAALELLEQGLTQLATVDAGTLTEDCVTDTVRRLGKVDGRVEGIQARFVAAAEAALLPERSGASSTTAWVSQQTGRSRGQSARTGRLAKANQQAPELTDAVANGDIGPDHANTVATGLDNGEIEREDVDELLPAARSESPEKFRRRTRQLAGRRRQEKLRSQELVARDERSLQHWRTANGSLRIEGLLPPAEGDQFEKAIGAFYEPDGKDVPDDQRRTHAQRSADAMAGLVGAALRAGAAGDVGGVRPHISVVVPYEAMAALAEAEDAGLTAVSDLGTVLSMAAFQKLACDARFRRVVIGAGSEPTDIGRATRQWPAPMRAAIMAADGGCRGPSCDLPPDRCIIHHLRWWEVGGETSVANGAPLCGRHHDLVHDDGWTLTMDPVTRICTWTGPDGAVVTTAPDGPATAATAKRRLPDSTTSAAPSVRDRAPTRSADDRAVTEPDRPATPQRPRGRGDPGRPRGPGADPPSRQRGEPDPPAPEDAEPLRFEI